MSDIYDFILSYDKDLKILGQKKLIDPNNPYKITEIHDLGDPERVLERHPEYKSMSYHGSLHGKYRDLTQYLTKFRCKACNVTKTMKAVRDEHNKNLVVALICSSCNVLVPLDVKVDINNIGQQKLGLDKRPELKGKATKLKLPLTESQKLGIDKASLKNTPHYSPQKTFLLEDSAASPRPKNFTALANKSLRRYGFPAVTNPAIKSVDNVELPDDGFRKMMKDSGKTITSESTVYNINQVDV